MTKIKLFSFLAVFGLFYFLSCQKLDYIEQGNLSGDGTIDLKSSTIIEGVAATGDTIYVEKGRVVNFQALAKGLNIVNWQWSFSDDNAYSVGATTEHTFWTNVGDVSFVTLTGVDPTGAATVKTKPVKVVWTLDGQAALYMVSCTPSGTGTFNLVFAFHKKTTSYYPGLYGFTGDMVSPAWTTKVVAVADTSWNYVNGTLVAPVSGAVGKFAIVRMTASVGYHEFAIGKIVNSNLIWGLFWGPYATENNMLKFVIDANGTVRPYTPPSMPTSSGDGTICNSVTDSSIILYVNNHAAFSTLINPFVRFQNSSGVYSGVSQVAAVGYPNWGKVEMKFRNFLIQNLLIFQFGSNSTVSSFMRDSRYYFPLYNNIQFQFVAGSLKSAQIIDDARELAIANSKL
jgi:hypothetical protein